MLYLILLIFVITSIYVYVALTQVFSVSKMRILYIGLILCALLYILYTYLHTYDGFQTVKSVASVLVFYLVFLLPVTLFLLIQDGLYLIRRVFGTASSRLRRKPWALICGACGATVFMGFIVHGIVIGKTDFKVFELNVNSPRVPKGFDGFKMVQISDLHLGSFPKGDSELPRAFDMIEVLQPDIIVLTGDILNDNSADMLPWISYLSDMKAPYGKYAVIGNHDYCRYDHSLSEAQIEENMDSLHSYYRQAGFVVLDNEHTALTRDSDTIYLCGVENWGLGPFPALGDIDKATTGIPTGVYTVLMSHDPAHFEHQVSEYPHFVDLTLSGHTHGMQFGVEIGDWKWSPIKYRSPMWAGEYSKNGRTLYVNRGLGYHFFRARVGIRPEITMITFNNI